MLNASVSQRVSLSCPVCRHDRLRDLRRVPAPTDGHVLTTCVCVRCGAQMIYEEDRTGRPVKR
jgi:C4-type Zn-finger protein